MLLQAGPGLKELLHVLPSTYNAVNDAMRVVLYGGRTVMALEPAGVGAEGVIGTLARRYAVTNQKDAVTAQESCCYKVFPGTTRHSKNGRARVRSSGSVVLYAGGL